MSDASPRTSEAKQTSSPGRVAKKPFDNMRILVVLHIVFGIIVWYIFSEGLQLLWAQMGWPSPRFFGISEARPPQLIAVGVACLSIAIVAFNSQVQTFANEVVNELRKVTWPSWKETRQTTLVVLVTTVVIALILGGWDFVFSKVIKELLTLPGGGGG